MLNKFNSNKFNILRSKRHIAKNDEEYGAKFIQNQNMKTRVLLYVIRTLIFTGADQVWSANNERKQNPIVNKEDETHGLNPYEKGECQSTTGI